MAPVTAAAALAVGAPAAAWTGHDTQLIVAAAAGIAVIVVLVTAVKMHPFLALTLGSIALGLIAQMPLGHLAAPSRRVSATPLAGSVCW